MSNLSSGINAHIRGTPKTGGSNKSPSPATADVLSKFRDAQHDPNPVPQVSLPESPSLTDSIGIAPPSLDLSRPPPMWLNPAYAKHIVKGNFMTLSARPKTVEPGEWIAHQVVEHYRNLWNFRWISGKIEDTTTFPTDPAGLAYALHPDHTNPTLLPLSEQENWLGARSGFPKQFANACQLIFRQIFRVYAHLYWDHFIDPFYHLNLEKHLNSCFSHFILTATALDLLQPSDVGSMQDLINLWAADGTFPPESRAYSFANLERGKYILSLGSTS
ncbi:hypothetical protein CDV31_014066 [Fusarium ambrosium]|uniref:Maintenance of ploidy protein mob2 n=1 Tax=Fusarium ambrosium TaxID=131363 RepID=A0A428SZ28_9HYPO|nr:hypothetical protein CDV31_014066 [Fusarium ambrosium]